MKYNKKLKTKDMENLGLGVMIKMLGGNEQTVNSLQECVGQTIKKVWLNDELRFIFENGRELMIWDGGQSCCEHRYMHTDDNLNEYTGAVFMDVELKEAPNQEDGEVHEVQFLDIKTDKGIFQMANHNEHNGYYGGFYIEAQAFDSNSN